MTTKDAINRLSYTVSKQNKPNQTDVLALNQLINYVNKTDKEIVQDNAMFGKLYTFALSEFLKHYTDIDFANKQLNKELTAPIEYHLAQFQQRLKDLEVHKLLKEKGIVDPFIIGKSIDEIKLRISKNKTIFQNITIEEITDAYECWDMDNIIAHLNRNITESLCLNR